MPTAQWRCIEKQSYPARRPTKHQNIKVGIMASIYKRKNANGTTVWRAVVRIKGYPSVCSHWDRKQEAEDWAKGVEGQIKAGQFKFDQHNKIHTFSELIERYKQDGALEHHRSANDTLRHLAYWQSRFSDFSLVHLTPELLGKERSRQSALRHGGHTKQAKDHHREMMAIIRQSKNFIQSLG